MTDETHFTSTAFVVREDYTIRGLKSAASTDHD